MEIPEWTLAVTKPQAEAKACENASRQGLRVLAPRLRSSFTVRGRTVHRVNYLFPSYLFVEYAGDHVYGILRNTIGISRVLLMAGQPAMCRARHMRELIQRMDADGFVELPPAEPVAPPDFSAGKRVRVQDETHYLFGRCGVSQGMDALQRVKVMMSFLGRKVPVMLEHSALAAA